MTINNRNTGGWNTGGCNTGGWNTGGWNTGDHNTGDWNAGDHNTGDWNAGDRNTGDHNTGNWNTASNETGFFNTIKSDVVRAFNKDCSRTLWDNTIKPNFLLFLLTEWVDEWEMTDVEKIANPTFHCCGGYLKKYEYKEAFQVSWNKASKEDQELVKLLPNFDADIFFEISGIRVDAEKHIAKTIVIEGKTYELKEIL